MLASGDWREMGLIWEAPAAATSKGSHGRAVGTSAVQFTAGTWKGLMIGLIREAFRVVVLSPFRLQHASTYVTTGVTLS